MAEATHLTPLQRDWFIALGIVKQGVPDHSVREIWERIAARVSYSTGFQLKAVLPEPLTTFARLIIAAHVEHLPQIERLEVLVYAAAVVWAVDTPGYGGDALNHPNHNFADLCFALGCHSVNRADIRERWHRLGVYARTRPSPLAPFEDRFRCGLCKQPVVTGSGAWSNQARIQSGGWQAFSPKSNHEPLWLFLKVHQPSEKYHWYNPSLHAECWNYASLVLGPQARRQAARELELAKGEQADGG